jgi:hypothetical protein
MRRGSSLGVREDDSRKNPSPRSSRTVRRIRRALETSVRSTTFGTGDL